MGDAKLAVSVVQLKLHERRESLGRLGAITQDSARSAQSFASQARMLNDRQIDDEEGWFDLCCGCIFQGNNAEYDEVVTD